MRDLKECQAEVFRRSEKRIKERKQRRNHILMACLPVVLCISLFLAVGLPGVTTDGLVGSSTGENDGNYYGHDSLGSLSCSISEITVVGPDFSKTYTDTADVLLISDQLYAYETRGWGDGNSEVADDGEGPENISGVIADSATAGYTITLVMHEGEKSQYRLAGNALKNLMTEHTHTLTQTQVNELYDLLGIPY